MISWYGQLLNWRNHCLLNVTLISFIGLEYMTYSGLYSHIHMQIHLLQPNEQFEMKNGCLSKLAYGFVWSQTNRFLLMTAHVHMINCIFD